MRGRDEGGGRVGGGREGGGFGGSSTTGVWLNIALREWWGWLMPVSGEQIKENSSLLCTSDKQIFNNMQGKHSNK